MTIDDKITQVQECIDNLDRVISYAVIQRSPEIVDAVRTQLWNGQNAKGNDITPSYLDDPYFKTRKKAEGYARWKWSITPNASRNFYAPNLFINGFFHSILKIDPQTVTMDVSNSFGRGILDKYGEDTFCLNPSNNQVMENIKEELISDIKEVIQL